MGIVTNFPNTRQLDEMMKVKEAEKGSRVNEAIPETGPITVSLRWPPLDEDVRSCVMCLGDVREGPADCLSVIAEGPGGICICYQCVANAAEIDSVLQKRAEQWERAARRARMLIGRLQVPSCSAWVAEQQAFASYLCNGPGK